MEFISEQQEDIVKSKDKYKSINGCAGSRKTDTLIKSVINDLTINKRPILLLTLVSSVTDEIKERLGKQLGISINKEGFSNHYIGYYNRIPICIANFDSWVHYMLEDMNNIRDIAKFHTEKLDILLNRTKKEKMYCYMKNKIKVGLLLIDEVQDFSSTKMNIILNISKTHQDLHIYCAGDYLQSLYYDNSSNLQTIDAHSINLFKRIEPSYFDLNICMRCPKAHVDFNNLILEDVREKYGIPQMQSDNDNIIDKPVLFTHYKTSDNTTAMFVAEQVTIMIKILMNKDISIVPENIAIIMAKTNDNRVFYHLENTLNKLYETLGYRDCVLHMSTYGDGEHNSLDWNKAIGKTKMLSIHGDKGRGHKVVFFLGLTENSIPKESHINKASEIVSESLFNVGTTRSTKYLFIGFSCNYPSRYLKQKKINFII